MIGLRSSMPNPGRILRIGFSIGSIILPSHCRIGWSGAMNQDSIQYRISSVDVALISSDRKIRKNPIISPIVNLIRPLIKPNSRLNQGRYLY